jgi:F-type H+-transporting ATPase subunit a
MNFDNRVLWIVDVGGFDFWVTETHVNTWIIMAFLIVCALFLRRALNNFSQVPEARSKQNAIEAVIETFDNSVKNTMGPENRAYGNWFFGVFIFILASNLSGLVNLRPPTADPTTTLALSIVSFMIIQLSGAIRNTRGYIKSYLEPWPIFLPMNIIGEASVAVSLGIRLFGNILAGLIVMGLIYYFLPWFLTAGLPAVFHAYFDLFAGVMQAFIFTVLSMAFIKNKL